MKSALILVWLIPFSLCAETLDDLLRQADQNNPAIAAARQLWNAASQQHTLAGALPDPRVSYGLYLQEVETKTGPQEQKAGVSQTIPLFGKRALAGQSAEHSATVLYARYRAARASVFFDLKKTWVDGFYLRRSIQTALARKTLFETLEKTVERSVEDGSDARDLLDIRITLSQIDDTLRTLKSQEPTLHARINALLNRDEQTPLMLPDALPDTSFPPIDTHIDSPIVEEQRALLAQRKTQEKLARRTALPDITLGMDWIQTDGGNDPLITSIALHLPIWFSKNRAERLRAEFEASAQGSMLQSQINILQAKLTALFAERDDAARRETFNTDQLIPPAEQHVELTRTAYKNSEADLRDLTASEERLLTLRLARARARAERAIAEANIEKLTGADAL